MKRGVAGWYPDPMVQWAARYWDGERWTQYVSSFGKNYTDSTPLEEVVRAADRRDGEVVTAYLRDAKTRSVIPHPEIDRLVADVARLASLPQAAAVGPTVVIPAPGRPEPAVTTAARSTNTGQLRSASRPAAAPSSRPVDATAAPPARDPQPARSAKPLRPSPAAQWWTALRHTLVSDVSVHGLAYLGVVLMFAGVFGLVSFSSGDVAPQWRGVADALAPASFFLAAWFLRNRRAEAVAASLSLLGGAVLPVVAVAALTDSSQWPPDLHGVLLPVIQAAVCMVIAAVMVAAVVRHPDSVQRYVWAPVVWFGVGVGAGVVRDPIPQGDAVARPVAVQFAAMAVAVAVTAVVVTRIAAGAVVKGAAPALVPGVAVAVVLEALFAGLHGWPVWSGVAAIVAGLVVMELRVRTVPARSGLELALVVIGALRLTPDVPPEWLGVGVVAVMLVLVELFELRRPGEVVRMLALTAGFVGVALAALRPVSGITVFAVLTVWSGWHRAARRRFTWMSDPFGAALSVAIAGLAVESWRQWERPVMIGSAMAAMLISAAPRRWASLRRDHWFEWWPVAWAVVTALSTAAVPWSDDRLLVAVAVLVCAGAVALSQLPMQGRTWVSAALAIWSVANAFEWSQVPTEARLYALASIGAVMWAASALLPGTVVRHLGHVGCVLGLASVVAASIVSSQDDRPVVALVVLAITTSSWATVAVVHDRRGARSLLPLSSPVVDAAPLWVASAGVLATATQALAVGHVVVPRLGWVGVPFAAIALLMSVLARLPLRRTPVVAVESLAATTVILGLSLSVMAPWPHARAAVVLTAALSTLTLAALRFQAGVRTWSTAAVATWTAANAMEWWGADLAVRVVVQASVAAVLVVAGAVFVRPVVRHLGWFGALVGMLAVAEVPFGRLLTESLITPLVVVAITTAAWTTVLVLHEVRGARLLDLKDWEADALPLALAAPGWIATAVLVVRALGVENLFDGWRVVPFGAVGLLVVGIGRVHGWRRTPPTFAAGLGQVVGLTGVALVRVDLNDTWPSIAVLACSLAVALTATPHFRLSEWLAWFHGASLVALIGDRIGVEPWWLPDVIAGFGAVVLLLAVAGRLPTGWRMPPALVSGGLFFSVGLALGVRHSRTADGVVLLIAAAALLAVVLVGRLVWLVVAPEVMAAAGVLLLIPGRAETHPWALVLVAGVLLGIAWASPPSWQQPSLVLGLVTAAGALNLTQEFGSVGATFLGTAALMFALAIVRRWPVAAVAGAITTLVGAFDLGIGWLSLALLLEAVAATVIGLGRRDRSRVQMLILGAGLAAWSWVELGLWLEWRRVDTLLCTAPSGAALALAAALALRARVRPKDLWLVWMGLGAVGSLGTAPLLADVPRPDGWVVALAMGITALAAGSAATAVHASLRWASCALAGGAIAIELWTERIGPSSVSYGASCAALVLAVLLLALHGMRPASQWLRPLVATSIAVQCASFVVLAGQQLVHPTPVVVGLSTSAGVAAAVATIEERPHLFVMVPVLACASWLVYAEDSLRDAPYWITAPVGLAVLAVAGEVRWIRRGRGGNPTAQEIAVLEYAGMSLLIGESLVRIVSTSLWYSMVGVLVGVLLALWGAVTEVRRRAGFGAGSVLASVVLLVGVPVATTVPDLHGPALWLAVAGVGAVAIVIATLLERGMATVRRAAALLDSITTEWERTGGPDVGHHHDHGNGRSRPHRPAPTG